MALTAQQPNAAASTADLTTTVAPVATTSSKGNKEDDSMKAGNFEKHPKLAKQDKGDTEKLKYTNGGKNLEMNIVEMPLTQLFTILLFRNGTYKDL